MKKTKLNALTGIALLAFLALMPAPSLQSAAANAQEEQEEEAEPEDETDDEPEDEGQANDGDGDVTNDDLDEVDPDADEEAEWSDDADDASEQQAEQVDDDNYLKNCRDSSACQATLAYVDQKLSQLLAGYAQNSTRRRKESPPSKKLKRGTTKYRVLPGQKLEFTAGKVGSNDRMLWGQVTKVIPRPQSDRLLSGFWVFRKKKDDTLAYVQGNEEDNKFRMGINEPNHLSTDLREQFLTVSHEFMHMVVMDQQVGDASEGAGPQDARSRKISVGTLLETLFGEEVDEDETSGTEEIESVPCDGIKDDDACYPNGTIYAEYVRKFWTKNDLQNHQNEDFYERNKARFVTEYATSSPHEDIAESFSYWVIAEGKGKTVADAKQRFFGRFPQLVALKDHIRRAVIADILKSRPAEIEKSPS
jgi:hypothetical protein